jgi:hypothetical protein
MRVKKRAGPTTSPEAETLPPPPLSVDAKTSAVRAKRERVAAATVDEVTADLTKDPRRDDDD